MKAERYVDPDATTDPQKLEQLQRHTIQVGGARDKRRWGAGASTSCGRSQQR